MKFINYNLENAIDFEKSAVWSLVCENPRHFAEFTQDFYRQTRGQQGKWKLYDGSRELDVSKNVIYVADYHELAINNKKSAAILQDNVKTLAFDEKHLIQTNEILTNIAKYFINLTQDIDYPITVKDVDVSQLLKSVNIAYLEEYDNLFEKLIDYVTLLSRLTVVKVVIFVNLRSYLMLEDIELLFHHCRTQDICVLCIESCYKQKLAFEALLCFDEDLCEFFPAE
ncbi:MAG: type II-A CRISPR-associated protein Csn2 [Corallococcus sp.]|nr:type II-A CRISPR-associated protein Csn2 [Corallococcus sp.]